MKKTITITYHLAHAFKSLLLGLSCIVLGSYLFIKVCVMIVEGIQMAKN